MKPLEQVMRAVRFKAFGDPSVLELAEVTAPAIDDLTALVRVRAASVNPSDVKNVAGAMKQTTLPRIPGRDYAGVVETGPSEWVGAAVWGTGGDAGFTRDGTHAELIAVPAASLRRKPQALNFDQAASVGVNYVAAWCGLQAAGVKAGETVRGYAEARPHGIGGDTGRADTRIRCGRFSRGADRRDLRSGRCASRLPQGCGRLRRPCRAATAGIEGDDRPRPASFLTKRAGLARLTARSGRLHRPDHARDE